MIAVAIHIYSTYGTERNRQQYVVQKYYEKLNYLSTFSIILWIHDTCLSHERLDSTRHTVRAYKANVPIDEQDIHVFVSHRDCMCVCVSRQAQYRGEATVACVFLCSRDISSFMNACRATADRLIYTHTHTHTDKHEC